MADRLDLIVPRRAASTTRPGNAHGSAPQWTDRAVCGNPQCTRSWLALLKDRRRPVFEQRWGCSAKCVSAIVNSAIRREAGEITPLDQTTQHRHRVPLGLLLLSLGWITHPQLQRALDAQHRSGNGRIGHWLIAESGIDQDLVTRALSMQWGCPVLPMEGFDPEATALAVPRLFVETLGLVPLRVAGGRFLYLAFADSPDASAALAIERMSDLKVESGLVDPSQWAAARQRLLACAFVDATFDRVVNLESMSSNIASTITAMQPRASRLVRLHHFYWLRMWLETGAMSTLNGGLPTSKEDVADRIYTVGSEQ